MYPQYGIFAHPREGEWGVDVHLLRGGQLRDLLGKARTRASTGGRGGGVEGGGEREREGGKEGGMLRTVPEPSRTPMGGTALHETLVA